jgi:hypothetical protein
MNEDRRLKVLVYTKGRMHAKAYVSGDPSPHPIESPHANDARFAFIQMSRCLPALCAIPHTD